MRGLAAKTAKVRVLRPDQKLDGTVAAIVMSGSLCVGADRMESGQVTHTATAHGGVAHPTAQDGGVVFIELDLSEIIVMMELAEAGDKEAMLAAQRALEEEERMAAERAAAAEQAAAELKSAVQRARENLGLEPEGPVSYEVLEVQVVLEIESDVCCRSWRPRRS